MTKQQKDQITALRSQGYGYATIAKAVGLKKDTIVAFCRKKGLTGTKAADNSRIDLYAVFCLICGASGTAAGSNGVGKETVGGRDDLGGGG